MFFNFECGGQILSHLHSINETHHGIPQWLKISEEVELLMCLRQFSTEEQFYSYCAEEKDTIKARLEESRVFSQDFVIPVKEEKIKINLFEIQKLKNTVNMLKMKHPQLEIDLTPFKQINQFCPHPDSSLVIEPLYLNRIKDGVFGETLHIFEEITLDLSLPSDNRLYPTLHCVLKEKYGEKKDSSSGALCVFELVLFEHQLEELIHQYEHLYSLKSSKTDEGNEELLKILVDQQLE